MSGSSSSSKSTFSWPRSLSINPSAQFLLHVSLKGIVVYFLEQQRDHIFRDTVDRFRMMCGARQYRKLGHTSYESRTRQRKRQKKRKSEKDITALNPCASREAILGSPTNMTVLLSLASRLPNVIICRLIHCKLENGVRIESDLQLLISLSPGDWHNPWPD